jgi:hypothetical protein
LVNVFLVGGGGAGGANGGGGGGGGRITTQNNIPVVPGQVITVTVGSGGSANGGVGGTSVFGGYSALGGNGGATGVGTSGGNGGASIFGGGGSGANRGGGGGGGAGSAGASSSSIDGANGGAGIISALETGTAKVYGAGGGAGSGEATADSPRPINGGLAGGVGAGNGGGEIDAASVAGQSALANTGAGGGGGAHSGISTRRTQLTGANSWNNEATAIAAQNGGNGGSGIVIVTYDEADYQLAILRPDNETVPPQGSTGGAIEGNTVTLFLTTRNVPNGTVVPYTIISPSGNVLAADFSPATLTGSFTVSSTNSGFSGTATKLLTIVADSITEENEPIIVRLDNLQAEFSFDIADYSKAGFTEAESLAIIRATDYNTIRGKVADVLGTGNADYGYGQPLLSSQVGLDSKVTVNEWAALKNDIDTAWKHQFGVVTSGMVVPVGSLDQPPQLVKANIATEPYGQYGAYADVLRANRAGIHSSQSAVVPKYNAEVNLTWSSRVYSVVTVQFTSANAARYFFNAGGELRFYSLLSSTSGNPQSDSWTGLLNSIGMQAFGARLPAADTEPNNALNYFRLSNVYQAFVAISATSPYSANTYKISARTPDVADNSNGLASKLEFLVEWIDDHPSISGSPDSVDGNISLTVQTLEASGQLSPSTRGNFTVETPTVTATIIQQ